MAALIKTIGLFMTSPSKAFAMTRRRGDYLSPIVFALIVGWVGFLAEQCWSLVFQSTYLLFLPESIRDQLGWVTERTLGGSIVGFVMGFALFPFAALVGLFISAAVLHLFLMLLGATSKSRAGFEGTVRVLAYSSVATLANVIPFAGSFIAFFWAIVLQTIGASTLHETGKGRALFAILIPVILCCACIFLFVGAIVTILGAAFAGVGA
ncbi:MAG: YIP1 family protein [bacterium]